MVIYAMIDLLSTSLITKIIVAAMNILGQPVAVGIRTPNTT